MRKLTGAIAATLLATTVAQADPVEDTLILNEETEMVTRTAAPAHLSDALDEVMSGWLLICRIIAALRPDAWTPLRGSASTITTSRTPTV